MSEEDIIVFECQCLVNEECFTPFHDCVCILGKRQCLSDEHDCSCFISTSKCLAIFHSCSCKKSVRDCRSELFHPCICGVYYKLSCPSNGPHIHQLPDTVTKSSENEVRFILSQILIMSGIKGGLPRSIHGMEIMIKLLKNGLYEGVDK